MKHRRENTVQQIALARIEQLFELAKTEFGHSSAHSHAWTRLAFKIATRNRVWIPERFKRDYCKKCHGFLSEGHTKTTRIKNGISEITCTNCHHTFKRKAPHD